jgi:excinuclease ABC subunit A
VVAEGAPEDVANTPKSYTGKFLAEILGAPASAKLPARKRKVSA